MLCWVVRLVGGTGGPVVAELALVGTVSEPVEAHVYGLRLFSSDVERNNAECSCVVCLHWCRGLFVPHLFEGVSRRDGFASDDEGCAKFGFSRRGHDCFDHLRCCENGAIVGGVSSVAGHKEVATGSAAGFSFGEVGGVTVACEDHVD